MTDLANWLATLGLEKYETIFAEQEVTLDQIASLNDADLKELGLPLGPRKRILDAALKIAVGAPATQPSAAPAAERRQLTVMFIDLVGSTALAGRLDPEDMRTILTAYHEACAAEIVKWGGTVAKLMGDGVLAYFGWPHAHENSAERAIRAGLDVNSKVSLQKTPQGEPLCARTGIATGVVVVGDLIGHGAAQEAAVVGETPNLAARLQSSAEPGQLVIADATRAIAGDMFDLVEMPPLSLKGISGLVKAFVVRGEIAQQTRFAARSGVDLSPLIGREHELALLKQRWTQASKGHGQVLVLTGDAGLGKSRLVEAFLKDLGTAANEKLLWQCSPYHAGSAFHPVVQALQPQANPPLSNRLKLRGDLVADDRALLCGMAGAAADLDTQNTLAHLTPTQNRYRTLKAVGRLPLGQSPALVIVEDAHWIDPSTQEALEANLEDWASQSIFVLITGRPSYVADFGGHAMVSRLGLNRLDREGVAAVISYVAGGHTLPADLLDDIAARSDGVPLYVEETAKAVMASGILRLQDGAWVMDGPLRGAGVPATLADSLLARLDRLGPAKEVAQIAAAIGRNFKHAELVQITGMSDAALGSALDRLIQAQVILADGVAPDVEYQFKHALLRDAAYESLLKSKRQDLHRKIYQSLLTRADTAAELLAQHAEAGLMLDDAITLWRKAAEAALQRPAFREAIAHYRRALTLAVTRDPTADDVIEIETRAGLASIAAQGHSHPATVALFESAISRTALARRPDLEFVVWYGLWCGHHVRGECDKATASSRALYDVSTRQTSDANKMMGIRSLGITALMSGGVVAALSHHEDAALLEDIPRDRAQTQIVGQDQSVSFRSYFAMTLWLAGQTVRARHLIEQSVQFAEDGGHVGSLGYALTHAIVVAQGLGLWDQAAAWTEQLSDRATEFRLDMWKDFSSFYAAVSGLGAGPIASVETALKARAGLRARSVGLMMAAQELRAADLLLDHGRVIEATTWLDLAEGSLAAGHECWSLPEYYRLRGRAAAVIGNHDQAFSLTRQALRSAETSGALALQLKAAVQLVNVQEAAGVQPEVAPILPLVTAIDGCDTLPGWTEAHRILVQHGIRDRGAVI